MYRTTGGPFNWQYFRLFCNLQKAQFCFVFFGTSNVTDRHRGPKQKLRAHYRASSRHQRAMYRARYACIRSSGIILTPLSYFLGKFCFCRTLHCWVSPWRKMAYWITQSLTHPAYFMYWEPKFSLRNVHWIFKLRVRVLLERVVHSVLLHHRIRIHQLMSSGWFVWLRSVFWLIRCSAGEVIESLCGLRNHFWFFIVWQSLTAVILVSASD